MIITLEIDTKINKKLLEKAAEDGHSNRSAVIRKAIRCFLAEKATNCTFRGCEDGVADHHPNDARSAGAEGSDPSALLYGRGK